MKKIYGPIASVALWWLVFYQIVIGKAGFLEGSLVLAGATILTAVLWEAVEH